MQEQDIQLIRAKEQRNKEVEQKRKARESEKRLRRSRDSRFERDSGEIQESEIQESGYAGSREMEEASFSWQKCGQVLDGCSDESLGQDPAKTLEFQSIQREERKISVNNSQREIRDGKEKGNDTDEIRYPLGKGGSLWDFILDIQNRKFAGLVERVHKKTDSV